MKNVIIFKNKTEKEILKFYNFEFKFEGTFRRIVFQLSAEFEFFRARTTLDAEEFDFINMKECLEKIYDKKWKSFIFNPIEEQFVMQFELQENGQIKIHVKLYNLMSTGKLEFEFITDQNFIPDLIKKIDTLLKQAPS